MRTNPAGVLIDSVVVRKNCAGTDIGFFTNLSVTYVAEVRNLGTAADLGIFGFHEGSNFALVTKLGSCAKVCKRTNRCVLADKRTSDM